IDDRMDAPRDDDQSRDNHDEAIADRELDDFFDHLVCSLTARTISASFSIVFWGSLVASSTQLGQQRKTLLPGASSTLTGTPIVPKAFSEIGQICWASAAARSASDSLSIFLRSFADG